jgi:hypothetical protein
MQFLEDLTAHLPEQVSPFEKYQPDPVGYAEEVLKLTPWPGANGAKGQRELFEDIGQSVKRQLACDPSAPRIFRVEAGNGVGKTYGVAMLVNWFFDSFAPSICYTTAPSAEQVVNLLWKNIKALRPHHLPGKVLPQEPRMMKAPNHFAIGKTTSNARGQGEERFKGQHDKFLLFVLDEAEGVERFVYDAILRMMTGGQVILVLIIGNPRTRTSEFHRWSRMPGVQNYRLSVLDHPNVVEGREVVEGATSRQWVIGRLHQWCEVVSAHNEDDFTFTLPWDVPPPEQGDGAFGPAGTIFRPNAEFMTSILGVAPANAADRTLISVGRFESACKRSEYRHDLSLIRMGIDVARFGLDYGTLYARHGGLVWREAQIYHQDSFEYVERLRRGALRIKEETLREHGPQEFTLHIRVDATGYGSGVIDLLKADDVLHREFPGFRVIEVHFGGKPSDEANYYDCGTEMYAVAAEILKAVKVVNAPERLGTDLTERLYEWRIREGIAVKKLEDKVSFRKSERIGWSPDDGDGFVLCVAPDHLFAQEWDFF